MGTPADAMYCSWTNLHAVPNGVKFKNGPFIPLVLIFVTCMLRAASDSACAWWNESNLEEIIHCGNVCTLVRIRLTECHFYRVLIGRQGFYAKATARTAVTVASALAASTLKRSQKGRIKSNFSGRWQTRESGLFENL